MSIQPQLQLTATIACSPTALAIRYAVENRGDGDAFVRVRTQTYRKMHVRPATVFRDGALVISYRAIPVPRGIELQANPIPFSACVERDTFYRDSFELPLPIEEWHPFTRDPYPPNSSTILTKKVHFQMEGFLAKCASFAEPREQGLYLAGGNPLIPMEVVFDLTDPLPVLLRPPSFHRF